MIELTTKRGAWAAGLVVAACLALAAPQALAQGVEAEGARDTIIGSEVKTGETPVEADAERIVAAIENTAQTTQDVRRRFNLGDVAIVPVSEVDAPDNPVAEAAATNRSRSAFDTFRMQSGCDRSLTTKERMMIEWMTNRGSSANGPVAAACSALAAPLVLAQGVEAEGARDTIIGSEVKTDETTVEADAERIVAAIENTAQTTQDVRRRFNLGDVAIVLVSDVDAPGNPVAEAIETHQEAIGEMRVAIESSAMFFHAVDAHNILLQNVIALEFHDDDVIIYAIGGGTVQ